MGWVRASVVALLVACTLMLLVVSPAMAECVAGAGDLACTPASPGNDVPAAAQLLALINADRASAGLPLMVARDDVTAIAVAQSTAMAEAGDIWHNDAYFTAETKRRLGARSLGENVALNRSTLDAHQRLMASPGHHANLVNPRFTVVGLAVVRDARGIGYITEDFVEPLPAGGSGSGQPPAPSGGGGGGGGGTLIAQANSNPDAAPAPAPRPSRVPTRARTSAAPAPVSVTSAAASAETPVPGGQEDPHLELAFGAAGSAPTPSPRPPAHVPLWATLVAAAGVIALTGRLVAVGVARRATAWE